MMRIPYEKKVLSKNDEIAAEVRRRLETRGIFAVNLIGSPGSGKTTLVERTARWCRGRIAAAALTGDQATRNDADRIGGAGIPAIQITTGSECHLNAQRILDHLGDKEIWDIELLLIENVGNLICPSAYDLGEASKVALLSVPEGDDKPLKYPGLFKRADLLVINKIDLVPYTDFDVERAVRNAREVAPHIDVVRVSCRTGQGIEGWFQWLQGRLAEQPISTMHPA
ncbi:MAG TPA: hydrogenase nickel incorporation protein HypB [Vicinamibacteria bacterium]|nr:hydrogenase nickel incorporation protein HypB [Vicinamibacteria bacterium]